MKTAIIWTHRHRREPAETLVTQRTSCEEYARLRGYEVVDVLEADSTVRHPGMVQAMLPWRLKDQQIDALILADYDRWGTGVVAFSDILTSGAQVLPVTATEADRHAFAILRESLLYFERRDRRRVQQNRATWDPTATVFS